MGLFSFLFKSEEADDRPKPTPQEVWQERRVKCEEYFGITLPNNVHPEFTGLPRENHFILQFPCWMYDLSNGCQDPKHPYDNCLIDVSYNSAVWVDNWNMWFGDPLSAYHAVKAIRRQGWEICPSDAEKAKGSCVPRNDYTLNADIESIRKRFEDHPQGFELYTVALYQKLGYQGQVTQETVDGGYDFILTKDGKTTIGECKLWASSIGRPTLQKLAGANLAVGADRMVFVTTSNFSAGAREYADQIGMELVNGERLMALHEGIEVSLQAKQASEEHKDFVELTDEEICSFIPADITSDMDKVTAQMLRLLEESKTKTSE